MATVLITGTNRGIGLEFVRQHLGRGDTVLAACRDPSAAAELKALEGTGGLHPLELDLGSDGSMAALARRLDGRAIDVLINNAGVYGPRAAALGALEGEPWRDVMRVNCIAPLLLTQMLLENLRAGEDRKLVFITSKMGSIADNSGGGSYIYRSSKAALNAAVKSLAIDLADDGFRAAVIHPGWVRTDMGGPNGLIDAAASVAGMMGVIDRLDRGKSGGFFNYDGEPIPW